MHIPNHSSIYPQLIHDYEETITILKEAGYFLDPILQPLPADNTSGEAYSVAFPIQGLLKYHGMFDPLKRIAFFPSISLNNAAISTVTYLKFDPNLSRDMFILNGVEKYENEEYDRVVFQLNKIRKFSKIETKAYIVSKNVNTSSNSPIVGKGLGTSAAGGAAIAKAAFSILYNDPTYSTNVRLQSIFSRYLSGSAARSSAGGIAIWMSSPQKNTWDSFAIRLDRPKNQEFTSNISLISIPLKSKMTTSEAHKVAPSSPLYQQWCLSRKKSILQFLEAIEKQNLDKIGIITEKDSRKLQEIHTSTKEGLPYWTEETKMLSRYAKDKRKEGVPLYFSIDTGPSVVYLTYKKYEKEILVELRNKIIPHTQIYNGSIGGPSTLITSNSNLAHLLDDDIEKFCK